MYLLSTAKTTVLTDFNDLETKAVYQHAGGEITDFQLYSRQRIFLEVNKKAGVEIMRIKESKDNKMDIHRVRKLNVEKVYCVACAKQSLQEMAFGGVNGQVSLYNYTSATFIHRFKPESTRNSVLYLDYNGTDEYIASVFENGQINLYGTKTKTKLETINIDNNSTLARFHPVKRLHLSVASFKGTVSIYDVQTKRKIFHATDAHRAPCRDLCMSAAMPDTLLSVGYDCVVNIFDTRRKTKPLRLSHCHPLSTAAMSPCGNYFCVGNLKGELISYDLRNTKDSLATRKVHDCAVTRIAFVPDLDEYGGGATAASFSSTGNQTTDNAEELVNLRKSINARRSVGYRDSFCDFLDFQANKGAADKSERFTLRRDSFDWETLNRKVNDESQRLPGSTSSSATNSANNSFESKIADASFINTRPRAKKVEEKKPIILATTQTPLRDRNSMAKRSGNLMQIEEENSHMQLHSNSNSSDKENPTAELELSERLQKLPASRNSTPNPTRMSAVTVPSEAKSAPETKSTPVAPQATADVAAQIAELRAEMNQRFHQLESEIKFNAEANKWQIFTQSANLWNQQIDNTEEIRDALGILLQTDPFVNEFLRLKEENELLKAQLLQKLEADKL